MWRVSRQNCPGQKLRLLLPKTPPKYFFRKTRFQFEFFYETTPSPILKAKWTMQRISRQNCPWQKLHWLLPKTPSKLFFRKTHFRSEFIYETTPHLFSWPNRLCDAFRGKIVPDKNFVRFCLKCPRNRFRVKHVSSSNFFMKPPPPPILGTKWTIWHV